mgnify:CR=1 FL=1
MVRMEEYIAEGWYVYTPPLLLVMLYHVQYRAPHRMRSGELHGLHTLHAAVLLLMLCDGMA